MLSVRLYYVKLITGLEAGIQSSGRESATVVPLFAELWKARILTGRF